MGRLEHLKQSLPLQQHPDCESIVVDWSCPDNCGNWVEENYPSVKVIRVPDQQYFHPSKARNLGLEAASGEFICKADADLLIDPSFFDTLPQLRADSYHVQIPFSVFLGGSNTKWHFSSNTERAKYTNQIIDEVVQWTDNNGVTHEDQCSLTGFCVFPTNAIDKLGSYHNSIWQTGGEDFDLRCQLLFDGELAEVVLDKGTTTSIPHSDNVRIENQKLDDFFESRNIGSGILTQKWGRDWRVQVKRMIRERKQSNDTG